jgi:peptide/nickel transport system substrate-binding protein
MGITRRSFISTATLAGLGMGLPALSQAQQANRKGTLRVMAQAALKVLDPVWTTAAITLEHGYLIYDKLYEPDSKGNPQLQMLQSHAVAADQLTHTMVLRDGLKFSDEAPVTGNDVVKSLQRWGKKDVIGQQLFLVVDEISAPDAKTIVLKLKAPFPQLPMALAKIRGNPAFIMPARVAETDPNTQITDTTGSGPFVFLRDQWKPGNIAVYEKSKTYLPRNEPSDGYAGGKRALMQRVEFVYIPDYNTALNAISAGDTDIWELLPNDLAPLVQRAPGVKLDKGMLASGMYGVNHLYPPFDKPQARQALIHLIDQKELLTTVTGDPSFFRTCESFFSCSGPYGTAAAGFADWKQDIPKAKQLFKEAGYDGRKIVLLDTTDIATLHAASLYLSQQLRRAGINVDLQAMDWSTTISRYPLRKPPQEGGWSIYTTYSAAVEQDTPFSHRYIITGDKAQPGWPTDPDLEQLRVAWLKAGSDAQRSELARQIQDRSWQVVPFVPWGEFYTARAHRDGITGFYSEAPVPFYWGIERKA